MITGVYVYQMRIHIFVYFFQEIHIFKHGKYDHHEAYMQIINTLLLKCTFYIFIILNKDNSSVFFKDFS